LSEAGSDFDPALEQQLAFAHDLRRIYDLERARRRELEQANRALAAANAELDRRVYDLLAAQDWILAVNSTRDLPTLMDLLAQPLVLLLHAQASVVFPLDPATGTLRGAFGHGVLSEQPQLAALQNSRLTGEVLARGTLVEIPDLDAAAEAQPDSAAAQALGWRALAAQPLLARGERVGVLYVAWDAPHQMDDRERMLLDVLAQHAALSLTHAWLYAEVERLRAALARAEAELGALRQRPAQRV
jgi:GAF domain-containing protein